MVAMIETMSFVGSVPWHGLGNPVEENDTYDIVKGIKTSGMDWEVGLKELFTAEGEKVTHRACYRKSDNKVLGIVGPRWTPVQNWDMFKWFQPMLDAKSAQLHTAGSLAGGTKVWVLAKLALDNVEVAKNDEVSAYVLLANSHDGSMAVRAGFTPIRVVCWNTLSAAIGNTASKLIRLRHSSSVLDNMDAIRDVMDLAKQEFSATAEQYKVLASKNFNQGDIRKYVKVILGVENVVDNELPKKTVNIMEEMFALIEGGRGQDNPAVKGTYWAMYNGVNEYLNYNRGRNAENRMDALWFGTGATMNNLALETALKMAG